MPKYVVYAVAYANDSMLVEADSKEEAIEKAFQHGFRHSCHQCPEIDDWMSPSEISGGNADDDAREVD